MTDGAQVERWNPPYIAYATLANFLDNKLGTNPLPPRIDRGFLDSYAGSVQAQLLSALRLMGFIGDQGEVLEPLREATRSPDLRKKVIRDWALNFYREQVELARQNATAQMLYETFSRQKYSGSTLRKAIVFYLSLTDDVGLPKSPHFRPPRQTSPRLPQKPATRRPPARGGQRPLVEQASGAVSGIQSAGPEQGERKVITLGDAGTVTITVNVRWLDLPDQTFSKLRSTIRVLEALGDVADAGSGSEDGTSPDDASSQDATEG
jgi:hypothetical protein